MKSALPILVFAILGCQEPSPYELEEADVLVFAEHRCSAAAACCNPDVMDEDCIADVTSTVLGYRDLTRARLTFSESCMSAVAAWAPEIDCSIQTELDGPGCKLAHGDRTLGEPCISTGDLGFFVTDCSNGLQCLSGLCVDDPFSVTQRAQEGEACDPYTLCEAGLFCNNSGTCQTFVEPYASCSDRGACGPAAEYYCRGFMTGQGECVPKVALGEPCDPVESACERACNGDDCQQLVCTEERCSTLGPAVCVQY